MTRAHIKKTEESTHMFPPCICVCLSPSRWSRSCPTKEKHKKEKTYMVPAMHPSAFLLLSFSHLTPHDHFSQRKNIQKRKLTYTLPLLPLKHLPIIHLHIRHPIPHPHLPPPHRHLPPRPNRLPRYIVPLRIHRLRMDLEMCSLARMRIHVADCSGVRLRDVVDRVADLHFLLGVLEVCAGLQRQGRERAGGG